MSKKAKRGDKEAFIEVFNLYKEQLYRTAFLYTKNKEDSLDVMQETAYRAFRNISNLKNPKYFKTWIVRITINCALNVVKSKNKVVDIDEGYLESLTYTNEDIHLKISIDHLLSLLKPNEKSVIILKFYFDYTFKEISETLELPIGTIKSIYYRSIDKLQSKAERRDFLEK
ncbi:sigma-70 family RNA polymerase sigma factor [Radiobacillus deserti]|uniref:Sigma-70 family RNA polymerase sigma factor n=1 Tax=Radiobacillus deserti TaxID=2594883 RepID=A0A516KDL1_9BACI|nr:sigma-70 family RNA polymerase sigma factor [Radiobacillus deserti]